MLDTPGRCEKEQSLDEEENVVCISVGARELSYGGTTASDLLGGIGLDNTDP